MKKVVFGLAAIFVLAFASCTNNDGINILEGTTVGILPGNALNSVTPSPVTSAELTQKVDSLIVLLKAKVTPVYRSGHDLDNRNIETSIHAWDVKLKNSCTVEYCEIFGRTKKGERSLMLYFHADSARHMGYFLDDNADGLVLGDLYSQYNLPYGDISSYDDFGEPGKKAYRSLYEKALSECMEGLNSLSVKPNDLKDKTSSGNIPVVVGAKN